MQQTLNTWQQQISAYEEALKAAENDELRASIAPPNARNIAPQLWQSINARTGSRPNPKGKGSIPTFEFEKNWALPAIIWILEHQQAFTAAFSEEEQAQLTWFGNAIVDSLSRVHFSSPGVGAVCPSLAATSSVREYEILQKIYQRNQNKSARACAALGMSLMLNNPMVSGIEGSEAMARAKRVYYLKQAILLAEKDTTFGKQPLTEIAMEQAYFLRNLAVGCIAPQIRVKDMEGNTLTIPEAGSPALLIFWSPADAAGSSMMRDIDKLKTQYPGIAIVPIMPYAAPEDQQKALQERGIASSYTDDAKGIAGTTYRIDQLPTVVLINKDSTIMYSGAPDMKLQQALEKIASAEEEARPTVIIKEAPAKKGTPATAPAEGEIPGLREMPEF